MYLAHIQTKIASHSYHLHCLLEAVSSRPGTAQLDQGPASKMRSIASERPLSQSVHPLREPTSLRRHPNQRIAMSFAPNIFYEEYLPNLRDELERRGIDGQGSRYDVRAKLARGDKGRGR